MNKEDIQRRYVEFQLIDQQIKHLQQQLLVLEQQAVEMSAIHDSLEGLKDIRPKTKAFATLGQGVFVEATLDETQHVIMDVGADVRVRKTVPEAQKAVQQQLDEIKKVSDSMETQVKKLLMHAQKIQEELGKEQA